MIPGTRGKPLTAADERVIRRLGKVIDDLHKTERMYDKLAKKHSLKRYPHGELPIGSTSDKKK